MSEISRPVPCNEAAAFLAEARRVRGLAADAAQPWMREALERIALGYEQLADLCERGADPLSRAG